MHVCVYAYVHVYIYIYIYIQPYILMYNTYSFACVRPISLRDRDLDLVLHPLLDLLHVLLINHMVVLRTTKNHINNNDNPHLGLINPLH